MSFSGNWSSTSEWGRGRMQSSPPQRRPAEFGLISRRLTDGALRLSGTGRQTRRCAFSGTGRQTRRRAFLGPVARRGVAPFGAGQLDATRTRPNADIDMTRKKMEGNEEQRRQKAREARRHGRTPSEQGVTQGASKQRLPLPADAEHGAKLRGI